MPFQRKLEAMNCTGMVDSSLRWNDIDRDIGGDHMKRYGMFLLLLSALFLSACSSTGGGLFSTCDPRFEHCGGANPQMQDEIADEVGQML